MKTKTISVLAALSLLPITGFAQPPAPPNPPNPPNAPIPPVPPNPPKDRDRDKGPKVPVTFLGVETSSVPRVVSEQLGLAKGFGLVVDYVVPDGPAAAAGLLQSDILKMLNDQILMEPDQLAKLIRSYPEGTNVVLTVLRKGAESKITVKLGKKEVSSRQNLFGPDGKDRHRHDDLGFNFDFNMPDLSNLTNLSDLSSLKDLENLKDVGPSIRDAVNEARREALRASREARHEAMEATKEARREAMRESGEARREALQAADEARRAARQFHVFSTDNGAVKSTKIDLNKAQITVTDPSGEMRIEKVNGKKMLTAKDPQGRLLFSGPVDSKEELDKVPADVRQRYDKLEQRDLPGVISTASIDQDEEADNDSENNDEEADNDSDNDNSDESDAPVQQVSYRSFPRSFWTLNSIVI
jgi:vacuolar-type H+-ATPase subunit H